MDRRGLHGDLHVGEGRVELRTLQCTQLRQGELTRADPEIVDGLREANEVRIGQRAHRQCALETGMRH